MCACQIKGRYVWCYLFFFCFSFIFACTSSSKDKGKVQTGNSQGISQNSHIPVASGIDRKKLLGVWWIANEPDAPHAAFDITDSTFFYPDQEGKSEFKYQLKEDSLLIDYDDYTISVKIDKATGDTLQLITDGEMQIYVKEALLLRANH